MHEHQPAMRVAVTTIGAFVARALAACGGGIGAAIGGSSADLGRRRDDS